MHTAIIRGIFYRSITILSIFVLLSGCHHSSSGHKSAVTVENANITSLTLSSGTLSPAFDVNTTLYAAQVANNVSSMTATMTTADPTSTITVNGQAVSSGAASQPINLSVGANANTIKIVVMAQDGITTKTYTVVVTRLAAVLSNNANLAGLSLSTGSALSPAFASKTTGYTAQVANYVSSITATPTAADPTSTITVNGQAVNSGAASQSINLSVGANTITVVVTAQNKTTTMTYAVVVSRLAASNNGNLAGLSLSTGSALSPAFTSKTTGYTAQVVFIISSIKITPTSADPTSTITVNGQAVSSGAASQSINLSVGANTITIVVTAQNGTTMTYAVVVSRLAASNNANLAGLSLPTGSALSPAFTSSTTSYTGQIPDNILSITITPTSADSTSTIIVNGQAVSSGAASQPINLSVVNTIIIVVTAQDGTTTKTYTVSTEKIRAFLWVSGDNTINQSGIYYGAASANKPGARDSSASWIDSSGNLWLFGGWGYDSVVNENGYLNDLWKFDGANWTWVSGDNTVNQSGIYSGAASANKPGSRWESVSWIDKTGNLWLFGGYGYDGTGKLGYLNDLWKFDGANWTWVSGSNTVKQYGIYGTIGAAGGVPGGRASCVSWIDKNGYLWLFGGWGYDSTGNLGDLNDLWKFDGANWTWVSGSYSYNQSGTYGTAKGTAGVPGGRDSSASWIDSSGNLWLFGGNGYDAGIVQGLLNDLWKFNGSGWIWVSGDKIINQSGVYTGAASANKPGARWGSVSWIDSSGILWLFGGSGYDSVVNENGYLDDLWKFDGANWTWVSGDKIINQSGVYGNATSWNKPGSRAGSISWIDKSGNLWFFGGLGYDSAGHLGDLNDLWQYK